MVNDHPQTHMGLHDYCFASYAFDRESAAINLWLRPYQLLHNLFHRAVAIFLSFLQAFHSYRALITPTS